MNKFYVVKGDVIRIPINEWVYDYFRRVFAWEGDRFSAYQATVMYELNPMFINDYTGSLWTHLYNRLDIDFAREPEYRPEFAERHLDFLILGFREDGIFDLDSIGRIFSISTTHYLRGIRLTETDVNKKFFIMGAGFNPRPSKEEYNANIKSQIKELESRLAN
jgi:hypothetical protein